MSDTNKATKPENIDIIGLIKVFESKDISSYYATMKEKQILLERKKGEFVIKREMLLRQAQEQLIKEERERNPKLFEEKREQQEKAKAEAEEKLAKEAELKAIEEAETKALAAASREKIVPFIKDIDSAASLRKVEPIRTDSSMFPVQKDAKPETETKDAQKKSLPQQIDKSKVRDDRRNLNKKAKVKKGYEHNTSSILYDDSGEIRKIRTRKANIEKRKSFTPVTTVIDHAIINTDNLTIKLLSEKIGKAGAEIIKKLIDLGIFKNINDSIDYDTAELIASEFNITLEKQITKTSEEMLFAFHDEDEEDPETSLKPRPPIVTIMGHVDHGKTSILDYIRHASVASGEAGGITQHIGAYSIRLNDAPITFIDTPGHAAFTAMRARGANVTDIAIIVVAADDGIMPQTIEAINHAKAAGVAIIVAINKMDKAQANPDRILQQLADQNVLVEDWGGEVPAIKVSAHTGQGIKDLLENILTVAEVLELKANPDRSAKGTIIESRLDKGKGPVATILVQAGTLYVSDFIVAGTATGKIRAMFDDKGKRVQKAGPSMAVSILGLQSVPNAGDQILVVNDEKLSKKVAEERKNKEKSEKLKVRKVTLEDVFTKLEEGKFKDLNLIIKADVQGSVEALKQSLLKLSNDEVRVNVVHGGVGAINELDIMLADTSSSIIVGFNIRPDTNAKVLAERAGIDIKLYTIIYEAIDEITKAIKGLLAPKFKEVYLGRAEVRVVYKVTGSGTIAGCMVKDGKITRNAKARLIRDSVEVFSSEIASLKRFKDDAKEVAAGFECGIGIERYSDIKEGDIIEAFVMEEEK